ncbi:sulfate permease, partial [Microbacterium sp. NPDC078428]|uniref:sulfate permease n=1 Tax=Microbacterium sp. NPDC078428 TaxID=3364190 RepID=UPI0037CADA82
MIRAAWNFGVSIHAFLQYAPTNLITRRLRGAHGLSRAAIALILAATYLFAAEICFTLRDNGGPAWIAFLGLLMFWNACKFGWLFLLTPVSILRRAIARRHARS